MIDGAYAITIERTSNLKNISKYSLLKTFIQEWSQHLDHVMFSPEDTNIDDPNRPEDEFDASDPFNANDSLRTTQVSSAMGIPTKAAGGKGGQMSGKIPGGRNQSVGTGR